MILSENGNIYKYQYHYCYMVEGSNALPNCNELLKPPEEIAQNTPSFLSIAMFAVVYLTCIYLFLFPVYGHPSPINYKPQPNQIINTSQAFPSEVTITFTERLEPRASSIKVMDSNNERIDNKDLKLAGSDNALSVSLDKSKITPGTYTINWLILSKDDGYITKGVYVFSFVEPDSQ